VRKILWTTALLAAASSGQTSDFEAMAVSQLPSQEFRHSVSSDWYAAVTGKGDPPRWELRADATAPSGSKVLAQLSEDRTSGRFPLAVYDKADLENGSVQVKFKAVSGTVDQAAGIVWRYTDENNYYVVRANALEDNVVLYKVEDGKRSSLSPIGRDGDYGVMHTVAANTWSTLAVAFMGPRFTVSFDGTELFQVEDATFSESGKVGLWTKADSVTYFDDFQVLRR